MAGIFSRPGGRTDTDYHLNPEFFSDEEFRGEYTGTNLIYKGFARPGGDEGEAVWQIAFLTYDGSNNVLSIQWPLGLNPSGTPHVEDLGTVTTPWTSFGSALAILPIVKGSVTITVGDITFTDILQDGTLTGDPNTNSGSIDYDTGGIALTINPALMMDTEVFGTYSSYSLGGASNDYEFIWSERHSYTYV